MRNATVTEQTRNQTLQEAQKHDVIQSNKEAMYRALEALEKEKPEKDGFSCKEIFQKAQQLYDIPGSNYSAYQPRLTDDLAEEGLVVITGTRECTVSGKQVATWEIVDTVFHPFDHDTDSVQVAEKSDSRRDKDGKVIWKGDNA